jgi:hypothetical protein
MFKKFLFGIILILSFLFAANFALTADPPPPKCTSGPCCEDGNLLSKNDVCDAWSEKNCKWGTGCGSDVGERIATQYCSGNSAECNGRVEYSDWDVPPEGSCQLWESCSPSTLSCMCNSACLGTPTNPITNPSPPNGSENVKLPVTLRWNPPEGAKSYRYKIGGVPEDFTTANRIEIDKEGKCLLRSDTDYNWGVRACCDLQGNDCGPWNNWRFKTSFSPQPISPKNNSADISLPVTLDWCDVADAKEYILRIYIDGSCHPYLLNENGECEFFPIPKEKREGEKEPILHSDFTSSEFFTKNNRYDWELASCYDEKAENCVAYGRKFGFFTGPGKPLASPELKTPFYSPPPSEIIPVVNFFDSLSWKGGAGTLSYQITIKKDGEIATTTKSYTENLPLKEIAELWDAPEDFDSIFSWQVKPCWDKEAENCETAESAVWKFRTTGATPNLDSPTAGASVKIPTVLKWTNVSKAVSYYYEVASDENFTDIKKNGTSTTNQASIEYPDINLNTQYWWRVKTCADNQGNVCGKWSMATFRTYPLNPPTNPEPSSGFLPITLKWTPDNGANFYQYKVAYAQKSAEELSPTCAAKEGQQIIPLADEEPPIIKQASFTLNEFCLGEYQWRVRSCLTNDCSVATDWQESAVWVFNSLKPTVFQEKGLVPCGRTNGIDILSTPWDEREPCQLKHLGYMLQNILDFLMWRLGLIIVVIFSVASGAISYFSLGSPTTITQLKSIWKSVGMGYGIILLAWILINLIMRLAGFQVIFFGRWWQLPF